MMNMSTLWMTGRSFTTFTEHTRVWTATLQLEYTARARFLSQILNSGFNLFALPTFPLLPWGSKGKVARWVGYRVQTRKKKVAGFNLGWLALPMSNLSNRTGNGLTCNHKLLVSIWIPIHMMSEHWNGTKLWYFFVLAWFGKNAREAKILSKQKKFQSKFLIALCHLQTCT